MTIDGCFVVLLILFGLVSVGFFLLLVMVISLNKEKSTQKRLRTRRLEQRIEIMKLLNSTRRDHDLILEAFYHYLQIEDIENG